MICQAITRVPCCIQVVNKRLSFFCVLVVKFLQAACCVVSSRSWPAFDAYVLSESSLFVYSTKIVLKTCGTTRLLDTLPELLSLAVSLNMQPHRCKFSRASYLFPELQVRHYPISLTLHNKSLASPAFHVQSDFCKGRKDHIAESPCPHLLPAFPHLDFTCSLNCTAASPQRLRSWTNTSVFWETLAPMFLVMMLMGCNGISMWLALPKQPLSVRRHTAWKSA